MVGPRQQGPTPKQGGQSQVGLRSTPVPPGADSVAARLPRSGFRAGITAGDATRRERLQGVSRFGIRRSIRRRGAAIKERARGRAVYLLPRLDTCVLCQRHRPHGIPIAAIRGIGAMKGRIEEKPVRSTGRSARLSHQRRRTSVRSRPRRRGSGHSRAPGGPQRGRSSGRSPSPPRESESGGDQT